MRDVERVLQLPRSTLQGLVRLGFVQPTRGARRQYLFSFQDLIILRAARALLEANIPRRRIRSSLGQLRERLPEAVPLSGLAICAVGDRVVVREGANHWQADDGQYLLGFDVSVQNGMLRMIELQQESGRARRGAAAVKLRLPWRWSPSARMTGSRRRLRLEGIDPAPRSMHTRSAAEADPGEFGGLDQLGATAARERRARVRRRGSTGGRSSTVARIRCCSSTWGSRWRIWATRKRHSRPITPRSRRTQTSPIAITTWRGSTNRPARPSMPSAISASTAAS